MTLLLIPLLLLLAYSITQQATGVADNTNDATITDTLTMLSGHQSDGSLTGNEITSDPSTWPGPTGIWNNGRLWDVCTAVALAEGFNAGVGAAPYDLNNPGDLSPGDEAGQATSGPAQPHGGSNVIAFATAEGGFVALYTKFNNIVTGASRVYPKTWTWTQVANEYAGDSAAWLANVTNYLGVDPSTTPASYVNA